MNYQAFLEQGMEPDYGPSERDFLEAQAAIPDYYLDHPEEVGEWDDDILAEYLAQKIADNRGKE